MLDDVLYSVCVFFLVYLTSCLILALAKGQVCFGC